tara:strand:- start:6043 stop:6969 length:927 start_codon:yes stop_codon:yes gene_type:complete
MSQILAQDSNDIIRPVLCDTTGKLQIDLTGADGTASSSNQELQLAQETLTATNTLAIDGKISKGNNATLTEAQQVGSYAVNESTGLFQPLSTHHSNKSLKTTDANITKGEDIITGGTGGIQQVLMYGKTASGGNNLQPVELTGDRLIVDVQELNVGFTQNTGGSMTQAGAVQVYGAYDDGLGGVRKMRTFKCDDNGILATSNLRQAITDTQTAIAVPQSGTFTSNTIDMDGFTKLTVMGSSTNTNDQLRIQYSVDDATYYIDNTMITVDFSSGDYAKVIDTGGARYVQIIQTDTQTTAFTMNFSSSKR